MPAKSAQALWALAESSWLDRGSEMIW